MVDYRRVLIDSTATSKGVNQAHRYIARLGAETMSRLDALLALVNQAFHEKAIDDDYHMEHQDFDDVQKLFDDDPT